MKVDFITEFKRKHRFTGMASPQYSVSSLIYSSRSSLTLLGLSWPRRPPCTAWITTTTKNAYPPSSWSLRRWARWRVESCAGLQKTQAWRKMRRTSSWNSASPRPTSQTGEKRRRKRRRQSYWTNSKAWHSLVSWARYNPLSFTLTQSD